MNNIILQPHGLGDVIFCQHLVRQICDGPIIWPVLPKFLEGLKKAYPDIHWIPTGIISRHYENIKRDCVMDGNRIIPIRFADQIQKVPYRFCMRSKYDMYNLDWKTWTEAKLNIPDSNLLFPKYPFCLVNRNFTSDKGKQARFQIETDLPIVEMQELEGYSLFDWIPIIQAATEIHTVSTSIIYLLELLELIAEKVHIYLRRPDENNHQNYDYILRRHHYVLE